MEFYEDRPELQPQPINLTDMMQSSGLQERRSPLVRHRPEVIRLRDEIRPEILQAMRTCRDTRNWPLVLTGPAGSGKTCAGLCLLDWSCDMTHFYECWELCDLWNRVTVGTAETGGIHSRKLWRGELISDLREANIVMLDELGARDKVSDAHYECVKILIDSRVNAPLVVSTNLTLAEISRLYDDRIASRLGCGTIIDFEGQPDRRLPSATGGHEAGPPGHRHRTQPQVHRAGGEAYPRLVRAVRMKESPF